MSIIVGDLLLIFYKITNNAHKLYMKKNNNEEIIHDEPTAEDILPVMDCIVQHSRMMEQIHEGELR